MDDTQPQHFEKVPADAILTDKYFEISQGGKVKGALAKHSAMQQKGGFSDEAKADYFQDTTMETNIAQIDVIKQHDINRANILNMAIRGMSKRTIAANVGLHERTVEAVLYSERGQAFMRKSLNEVNDMTALILPTLAESAFGKLEDCLNGKGDRTQLAAVEMTLNLVARLEKMSVVKLTRTKTATATATE